MINNITAETCIELTDDEFLVLMTTIHEINWNTERGEEETFRSLIRKMYDINLCKALASLEAWTNQPGETSCHRRQ